MGKRASGLQLDQHPGFQRTMMVVRYVGMVLLLVAGLAALAGLFGGDGPMAQASAGSGPVDARYPRFTRYLMPTRYEFEVDTAAIAGDSYDIVFDGDHARDFSFEDVLPQPREVAAADDQVRYTFKVEPGERQLVVIQGQPEAIGQLSGTVAIAGQPPLRIDGFVYP